MSEWRPPPRQLKIDFGQIHVWAVELSGAEPDQFLGCLSLAEQSRAARFKFERDRRRFVVAHGALRQTLARYLEAEAAALRFDEMGNGKPILAAPYDSSGVRFNLSHSHETALMAVVRGREVGVDIEFVNVEFAFGEVAERFFTAREVAAMRALPEALRRQAFYKCWTSKEAFLKAKGVGLSGMLDEVEIVLDNGRTVKIDARVPGWSLAELNCGENYQAAVVVEGNSLPNACYQWQPIFLS